ncbi:uncharacterized protein TrAFT101_000310 [Trichoderma asperellum]|uniref:uncharacterized protein n=1 Tax=Trichoderma asperellum TaxID=101201 RepID=UPI003319ED1B|nr:hypothetical protein TrAFT101_000310 [Trichoderma asperellum]
MQIYRGSQALFFPACNVYSSSGYAVDSLARSLHLHSSRGSPLCRALLFGTAIRKDRGVYSGSQQAARQGVRFQFFYKLQLALLIRHLFVFKSSTHPRSNGCLGMGPRTENHVYETDSRR